jgi:hypothetical protein
VEKAEDFPACHPFSAPCDDLALECTDSKCSFIIHGEKRRLQAFMIRIVNWNGNLYLEHKKISIFNYSYCNFSTICSSIFPAL